MISPKSEKFLFPPSHYNFCIVHCIREGLEDFLFKVQGHHPNFANTSGRDWEQVPAKSFCAAPKSFPGSGQSPIIMNTLEKLRTSNMMSPSQEEAQAINPLDVKPGVQVPTIPTDLWDSNIPLDR